MFRRMQICNKNKKVVDTINEDLELSKSDDESDDESDELMIRPNFYGFNSVCYFLVMYY